MSAVLKYNVALTIAGSDSGGGAGIQADLKTFTVLGCYGASAITAITAQNTLGVQAIYPVEPEAIEKQITAVLSDLKPQAVKLGMLLNSASVEAVKKGLGDLGQTHLVIDTVMASKNGSTLLDEAGKKALIELLLPKASLITPNIPEAEQMLNKKITSKEAMQNAAMDLLKFGCKAVLLKGGHLIDDESNDCFVQTSDSTPKWFKGRRIQTKNLHGTGCTLSAAITAYLAKGENLEQAIQNAKIFLENAIVSGSKYSLGSGTGPLLPTL